MTSTLLYNPDPGAYKSGVTFIQLLSQRDLGLQIPLNYVTTPGIFVTPACFAHNIYEANAAAKCFSNLLAVGFDRIVIDVYWDVTQQAWSMCPVQLGSVTNTHSTHSRSTAPSSALTSSVSFKTSDASDLLERQMTLRTRELGERQEITTSTGLSVHSGTTSSFPSSSVVSDVNNMTMSSPTTSMINGTPVLTSPSSATSSGSALQVIGPYTCSQSTNLNLFMSVLSEHLDDTQRNLNASIKYLILNVHAATSASKPLAPADQPPVGTLPQGNDVLSQVLSGSTSAYLYTPSTLDLERSNLNHSNTASWYDVPGLDQPDSAYFQLEHLSGNMNGDLSTPNGWPGEGFVEQRGFRRLLAAFGEIDPQMVSYNFTADQNDIFDSRYISSEAAIIYNSDVGISSGCFYQPNMPLLDARTNSSWAVSGLNSTVSADVLYALASNLTSCGISPILNQTLSNVTADRDYRPYKAFINSTIWAWQPGQPTSASSDLDSVGQCAVLNSTTFRLQQEDCSNQHHTACRVSGLPYTWQISRSEASYMNADKKCAQNSSFSVPRTALESTYLGHTWQVYRSANTQDDDATDELLWVDFNDLDITSCWVIGQNTTCPYISDAASETKRIVVPVVAAIIVFVLTLLTVFVKCAGNRRNSKVKRKRGMDGWDYEGVPS